MRGGTNSALHCACCECQLATSPERQLSAPAVCCPQVALVDAVAAFLQRSAQGQLEHSRGLVQWLLRAAASPAAPVRSAVLRCAPLFAEPQVVLALCHEGAHPIHTKDREAAVEALEAQARPLQAAGLAGWEAGLLDSYGVDCFGL